MNPDQQLAEQMRREVQGLCVECGKPRDMPRVIRVGLITPMAEVCRQCWHAFRAEGPK